MDRTFPEDCHRRSFLSALGGRHPGVTDQGARVPQDIEDGHLEQTLLFADSLMGPEGSRTSVRPLDGRPQFCNFAFIWFSYAGWCLRP
jgi:hypothetical protein